MPRIIPQYQVDDQLKYLYRNRKGKRIYKPIYEAYNENFFTALVEKTEIKATFTAFKDTAIYERYILNAVQFSAAKSVTAAKLIQSEVYDDNKNVRPFTEFKKKAEQVAETINDNWLRVEYESARRQCVASEQYRRMYEDRDLYPYWQYRGRMDAREREDHKKMEGLIFRIGDPEGDKMIPPNGWNCRCEPESVDDDYLIENSLKPAGPDQLKENLKENVNEQFRHNPTAGILPKTGSYFELMPNANYGSPEMFGLPDPKSKKKLDGLHATFAAKGVHQLANQVDEWKEQYHVNKDGDVVFQNTKTFSNVLFTAKSLHTIQKHARGFENIPDAVSNPNEIWNYWDDAEKQQKSVRNYIIFGSVSYVVQTVAGEITDAFAVNDRSINKYRKGVIL